MASLTELLQNYQTVCRYCDTFFYSTVERYPEQINCHQGCDACCELQSVNALEAFSIWQSLQTTTAPALLSDSTHEKCIFLNQGTCSIYAVRPLICRTHGLVISSSEFPEGVALSCRSNFKTALPEKRFILDSDKLTENLMRLNLAFCLLCEDRGLSSERFFLADITGNNLPESLKRIQERLL